MLTVVGHSDHPSSMRAVDEILAQCRKGLQGRQPDFGFLTTSRMEMEHQAVLGRILDEWPELRLIGCTTDGEISDTSPSTVDSLNLLLIQSDGVRIATGIGRHFSRQPEAALAQALHLTSGNGAGEPQMRFVIYDGVKSSDVCLETVLRREGGAGFPVFGVAAGDHFQFKRALQFHGRDVHSDALIMAGLSGPLDFSFGFESGCKPVGQIFAITKIHGNAVYEIDDLPILDFYKKYFGANYLDYLQFPLAVQPGKGEQANGCVLRKPLKINPDQKSIMFSGGFPDSPRVRLTAFNARGLIAAAHQAAQHALDTYPGNSPSLALICPCASRRHVLGSRALEEHETIVALKTEHPGMNLFGMYGYGNIGCTAQTNAVQSRDACYSVALLGEGRA